ncbi:uncharacterized protein LOC111714606 isoform X2 [Eurytemora carolleeae]|uniref:uncharacterized protein LOC111714606 isoform X2 n=1 Tax=Eurytemora carolleeae TaxID=1294199 RepID=UPI000C785E9C|nr:uncharacterized protein LOC111714606 isoform X2 [Eurytemora carolleeae]|eukprot:XP_023345514.1 uncharacterized protein LOC111714606 isoform X2 [Eurytemora affinis]
MRGQGVVNKAVIGQGSADVTALVEWEGLVYAADDRGGIQCFEKNLDLLYSWTAHTNIVNDLAANSVTGDIYSCSGDGEIKLWKTGGTKANLVKTVHGTDDLCLQSDSVDQNTSSVRRLVWQGKQLYSGNQNGEVFRWSPDLELLSHHITGTDIWSMCINENESCLFTAKDNDVIISSQLKDTDPGVEIQVQVWGKGNNNWINLQELRGHDMIVNSMILLEENYLATAGWDKAIKFWRLNEGNCYELADSIQVESYITCLCSISGFMYAGGRDGIVLQIKTSLNQD